MKSVLITAAALQAEAEAHFNAAALKLSGKN
jgi:hypothetical protein